MKFYFLHPDESPLANPETAVLESVRRELLRRPGHEESANAAEADAIIVNEPWDFRQWRYIDDLLADPVIRRFPQKTYTINSDDGGTGLLRGVYSCLEGRRFDPALHAAVPFISSHNTVVFERAGTPRPDPSCLATFKGNLKSNRKLRGSVVDICKGLQELRGETSDRWLDHSQDEKRDFVDLLRSGKFALCPAGWAAATFRIYESMALGVAPVIIADNFNPPKGPDWSSVSVRIAEKDVGRVETILRGIEDQYLEIGERAHAAWQRHFSPGRIVSYYCDALMQCILQNEHPGSREDEIRRWRSSQMYLANGWTLPQRIANRARRLMTA